jgi:acetate kinase
MRLLIVNAGSSSLKLSVLDARDRTLAQRELPWPRGEPLPAWALRGLPDVDAIAHRVVHGGDEYRSAAWIDADVRTGIEALTGLAPLHQPRALAAIDAARRDLPAIPAAACFDTAFHASLPPAAATYALPLPWRRRRFGFHGLSHAYAVRRAAELLRADPGDLRIVSCHLGAGASLAAVASGRSVDTTMGFTPLEGLVMATRAGSVDPGLLLWLIEHEGVTPAELADGLERRSGLVALAGTGDMREILARAEADDGDARAALDVYVHRLRAAIAAMTAAMNGLDVLVFTGGVGEHAAPVRAATAATLSFLGIALDERRNAAATADADIGRPGAATRTVVVSAREDLEMARQVRALGPPADVRRPAP